MTVIVPAARRRRQVSFANRGILLSFEQGRSLFLPIFGKFTDSHHTLRKITWIHATRILAHHPCNRTCRSAWILTRRVTPRAQTRRGTEWNPFRSDNRSAEYHRPAHILAGCVHRLFSSSLLVHAWFTASGPPRVLVLLPYAGARARTHPSSTFRHGNVRSETRVALVLTTRESLFFSTTLLQNRLDG